MIQCFIAKCNDIKLQRYYSKELLRYSIKSVFKVEIEDEAVMRNQYGKPSFKNNEHIKFNISHCDGLIACAVGLEEIGVDVENTTMIVIFDANRFGLSTLHQLRGRVGRSNLQSSCILISDVDAKRLEVMTKTNDGFEISEEDFKLRGHGDLFGTKQSGDMTFKIANIKDDYKILLQAKKDSLEFIENDSKDYKQIKEMILNDITEG